MNVRGEYIMLGVVLLLMLLAALVLAVAVYFFVPQEDGGVVQQPATTTSISVSTTLTSSTETTNTILQQDKTSSTLQQATSSTLQDAKQLSVKTKAKAFFKNDDIILTVTYGSEPVDDAVVTLDGINPQPTLSDGTLVLLRIDDGNHTIVASKEGYENTSLNISVDPLPYVLSAAVKTQHTPEERAALIAEGKVVFRFYDEPNCPNCLRMKPWAADIANANRECVSYELLNMVHEGPREEVKGMFPNMASVVTPVVVIEGNIGHYVSMGFLPKSEMEGRIKSSSDGRCLIG